MYLVIIICLAGAIIISTFLAIYARSKYLRTISVLALDLSVATQNFEKRENIHKKILDIAQSVAVNMEFEKSLQELLPRLAELTRSNCCAFYAVNNATKLVLKHSIGFSKNVYTEFDLTIGEGFIGQLALERNITLTYDVPDDTIYMVRTFLGKIKPRNLMVVPVFHNEHLNGVLVCASIQAYTEEAVSLVEMLKYYLSVAVDNGIKAEKNKRLANELAFQNKLIQNQHEEMRMRLKEKELLVHHLAGMIEDEIAYVLDADCKVLYWSSSAKAIYGLTKEHTMGRHIDHIHGQLGWDSIENLLKMTSTELEYCTWFTGRTGRNRRFELLFTFLKDDGPLGIVAKVKELDVFGKD